MSVTSFHHMKLYTKVPHIYLVINLELLVKQISLFVPVALLKIKVLLLKVTTKYSE